MDQDDDPVQNVGRREGVQKSDVRGHNISCLLVTLDILCFETHEHPWVTDY